MYQDYYLKFTDEAEAKAVLYHMEGVVEADEENGVEANEGYEVANYKNIDVLGVIYERPSVAVMSGVVGEYEPIPIDGWHVNVRVVDGEDSSALEAYAVMPSIPRRVWG